MFARTLSFALTCAIAFFPIAGLAQTDSAKQMQKSAKIREKVKKLGLGERVKVKAKLYSGTTYQGYVREANDADFVVVDKNGDPHTLRYSDVDSIGGRNLSTGAKIAIGIGIGVGAVLAFIGILIASLDD